MDKKVFSVYMGDPDRSNHAELDLPATPWELIDALDKLRLVDGREPYWQVEDIGRYGFLAPLLDDSDLYQFNALAEQLSTFDHVEAIAFEGLVQMEVDELCQTNGGELTLQRLLDLAYSVDCCHVVPGIRTMRHWVGSMWRTSSCRNWNKYRIVCWSCWTMPRSVKGCAGTNMAL